MSTIKNKTKIMLFKLLRRLAMNVSSNKAIILNYHRVMYSSAEHAHNSISAIEFKNKMLFLKEHFNVVSFPELISRANNNNIEPLTVVITIDDGYEDSFSVITPILKELGIQGAFFIATEGIEKGSLWNDQISKVFNETKVTELTGFLDIESYSIKTVEQKKIVHDIVHQKCKFLPIAPRTEAIKVLEQQLKVDVSQQIFLSESKILAMHNLGMTIGAHTHRHPILSLEEDDVANEEISGSKKCLEKIINSEVKYFAYPNGKKGKDFVEKHQLMLKNNSFEAALTTDWGYVTAQTDQYCIPRFTPWDVDEVSFGIRLCNFFINKV